jgi:hypothetical protein
LNPGSVGCPSYDDPGAVDPHVSESGSPHARYAILTTDDYQMSAELIAILYDWKAASARAEANGRPDWAYGFAYGLVQTVCWVTHGPSGRSRFSAGQLRPQFSARPLAQSV